MVSNNTLVVVSADIAKRLEGLEEKITKLLAIQAQAIPTESPLDTLTVEKAAEVLGLSVSRMHYYTSHRKIPFTKRGRRLYFSRRQLAEWVAGINEPIKDANDAM